MELNHDTIKKLRGLILFTVVAVVAGINYRQLLGLTAALVRIAGPFILGGAIAFILNVPMRNIERHLPLKGRAGVLKRPVSLALTIFVVTGILFLVTFVVTPQLFSTFEDQKSVV